MINIFIFMGRPGAGKGAQSEHLSKELGFSIFSSGNLLRLIAAENTKLGKRVKEVIDSGDLMPYWFASFLFQDALFKKKEDQGIIFEGAGRTESEAKLFGEVCEWLGDDFRVVHLNVSVATVVDRLSKRQTIENRADDAPERIKVRLGMFDKETQPALDYFRSVGKVIEVDGEPVQNVVFQEVLAALAPFLN